MSNKKDDLWEKLKWGNKVSICEQARASENYLLNVYIVIFMAIQAVLFGAFFTKFSGQPMGGLIAFLGIWFAFLWACVTESRGNHVDLWEKGLHSLWDRTSQSNSFSYEVAKLYKGAADRWDKRKANKWSTFKGWDTFGDWERQQLDRTRTGNRMFQSCRREFMRIRLFLQDRFKSNRWVFVAFIPFILALLWLGLMVWCFVN